MKSVVQKSFRCGRSTSSKLLHILIVVALFSHLAYRSIDVDISSADFRELHHPDFYATLAPPDQIDFSVEKRLSTQSAGNDTYNDSCNDILLFMPYTYSINGQGAQLNSYIHASLLATFMNKPLVVMESPNFHVIPEWAHNIPDDSLYDSESQFGCPSDYFNSDPSLFPSGLSRLIQIPSWISKGCQVPTCDGKFSYHNWEAIRRSEKKYFIKNRKSNVRQCVEADRIVNVTVAGGAQVRRLFLSFQHQMLDRSTNQSRKTAYEWAIRLGASVDEAKKFQGLQSSTAIWDYLSALINRSGLMKFQPWIARDVDIHIQASQFPLDHSYDAIHVRRGDKLLNEAKGEVAKYWGSKGYVGESTWPTNFIPFSSYLEVGWGRMKCKTRGRQKRKILNAAPRDVFLATDDPTTVISEMGALPKSPDGYPLLDNCGHKANFLFSPSSKMETTFHINDRGAGDDCHKVYARNLSAISDMIILARANKLVADFNSNWGRFIRTFRLFLDNKHNVVLHDMVSAFGPHHPGSPGI